MHRVLVAGATGYLGRHVVASLKQRGYWVRALARNPRKLEETGQFLEPAVHGMVDDLFVGEATQPETLQGLCDGIDAVVSSLGITRQNDGLTFRDVDYQANRNVLDIAEQSGVKRFVFVSVFQAELLSGISLVRAREDFVSDLRASDIISTVIRPTGYFSDISELFHMARSGRVYLIGDGSARGNPIHGADLAGVCVTALESEEDEIAVGGPQVFTYREIAELAFRVTGGKRKITCLPRWLSDLAIRAIKPFSSRLYDLSRFFSTATQNDFVAPPAGSHTLEAFFRQLQQFEESRGR